MSDPVPGQARELHISLVEQAGRPAKCSRCQRPAPGYDRLPARAWLFIPLWGLVTRFFYAARRVQCPEHGVVIEHVAWSDGKRPVTLAMMGFLARWGRRRSWRETARWILEQRAENPKFKIQTSRKLQTSSIKAGRS